VLEYRLGERHESVGQRRHRDPVGDHRLALRQVNHVRVRLAPLTRQLAHVRLFILDRLRAQPVDRAAHGRPPHQEDGGVDLGLHGPWDNQCLVQGLAVLSRFVPGALGGRVDRRLLGQRRG
jgi:hypothetical protein